MLRTAALLIVLAVAPAALHAEVTTARLLNEYNGSTTPIWGVALNNTYLGFVRSNELLQSARDEKPLFCAPANQIMADQLIEALRAGTKRHPDLAEAGWRDALLRTLVDQYPCR
jgi:hypothetical protein